MFKILIFKGFLMIIQYQKVRMIKFLGPYKGFFQIFSVYKI